MKHALFRLTVLAILIVGNAEAQSGRNHPALAPAALRALVDAIAHDSTGGRATTSRELEASARYVALKFSEVGLGPLGDDGSYFQRYPLITSILDVDSSRVIVGGLANWQFGKDFYFGGGFGGNPSGVIRGPAFLVSGVTRETAGSLDVRGKVLVYQPPTGTRGRPDYGPVFALGRGTPAAIIVPGAYPESTWVQLRRDRDELMPNVEAAWTYWNDGRSVMQREGMVKFIPILELWSGRVNGLTDAMRLDAAGIRSGDGTPKMTPIGVEAVLEFKKRMEGVNWPTNVVGVLSGADPVLRNEYVVVTAHLDGLGRARGTPPGPASVLNGADDNASGIASIIQVAKVFATTSRPKRSVIFVAVSGEELGLWGSDYFAAHPPVPVSSIVANINLDMVGRAKGDTVYVTGRKDPWLGPLANGALRATDRRLVVVDEQVMNARYPGQDFDTRSDHVNFRRRGIPALWFYTGTHDDYHETTDDTDKLNYDAMSRITHAVTDVIAAIGNAPIRPARSAPSARP